MNFAKFLNTNFANTLNKKTGSKYTYCCYDQKQPPDVFDKKKKASVLESLFNKVEGLKPATFLKKGH